jgi:hypothetical protein
MEKLTIPSGNFGLDFTNTFGNNTFGISDPFAKPAVSSAFTVNTPDIPSELTQVGSKILGEGLKQGVEAGLELATSSLGLGTTVIGGTGIPAGGFAAATGVPFAGGTAASTGATAAAGTGFAGALSGAASALTAAAPVLAVFQGLSLLNGGIKAVEISEAVNFADDAINLDNRLSKRITGEHQDIVNRKILPVFSETIEELKSEGIDLSEVNVRLGAQGGERGTLAMRHLILNVLGEDGGQEVFENYIGIRKEVQKEHEKEEQDFRITHSRNRRLVQTGSPLLDKQGQVEPEIAYIEATDRYGNTKRFNYLNFDGSIIEKDPSLEEVADRSREIALGEYKQFVSSPSRAVLPPDISRDVGIPSVGDRTAPGRGGTAVDLISRRSIGQFRIPEVTRRGTETSFARTLREIRNS